MNPSTKKQFLVALATIGCYVFFRNEAYGLNALVFTLLIGWCWWHLGLMGIRKANTAWLAWVLSSVFLFVTHNGWAHATWYISAITAVAVVHFPTLQSVPAKLTFGIANFFAATPAFVWVLRSSRETTKKISRTGIYFLPVLVVLGFFGLYFLADSTFRGMVVAFGEWISARQSSYSWEGVGYFVLCFWLAVGLLQTGFGSTKLSDYEATAPDDLNRIRKKYQFPFKPLDLKWENKAGVFLLIALNALVMVVNIPNMFTTWLGKAPERASDLSQDVHFGTFALIVSVMMAGAVLLYLFKKNQHFYAQNARLKQLAGAWIGQNAFLVLTVALKNMYYVSGYGLTNLRVGVFVFLMVTLLGLYTLLEKIFFQKTIFYVVKQNSLAVYIMFFGLSGLPLDWLIAHYNMARYKNTGKIDVNYALELSPEAWPLLDELRFELVQKGLMQEKTFQNWQYKKAVFLEQWNEKGILSYNLAEAWAAEKLKEKK